MLYIITRSKPDVISRFWGPVLAGGGVPHKFVKGIELLPPLDPKVDALLVTGKSGLEALEAQKQVRKKSTIGSNRGMQYTLNVDGVDVRTMLSYDASLVWTDYGRLVDVQWDMRLAMRLHRYNTLQPQVGHYEWVKSFAKAIAEIEEDFDKTGRPVPVSLDLETVGLNPYDPERFIVSVFITHRQKRSVGIRFQGHDDQPIYCNQLQSQIKWLLTTPKVKLRGANLKYDLLWIIVKWQLYCTNYTFDTTLVGSLLDENSSNSLTAHANQRTSMGGYDFEFNQKYDKGRMDLIPDEDLLVYAGGDTDACLRVSESMINDLVKDQKLATFYTKLLHPACMAFLDMEEEGVLINKEKMAILREDLVSAINEAQAEALAMMPRRLKIKYRDNLALTRAALLRDFLFTDYGLNLKPKMMTDSGKEPSTAAKHLMMFDDVPEAVEFMAIMKRYNSATKTLGTFVDGFMAHLRPDSRFHPTYVQYRGDYGDSGDSGTVTGRLAAKDPAVQTVPKHTAWAKRLRECYEAPEGYVIVNWDYSQGELRIAACLANEKRMIEVYLSGIDLHLATGARLNGYTLEQALAMKASPDDEIKKVIKRIRQGGKAGNFGLIYGMQAEGYQTYARDTYGVHITLQEATGQRAGFFEEYPGLEPWHKRYIEMAKKEHMVRSPLGRIRHLPMIQSDFYDVKSRAERQAINSPVQSTLSDLSQLAMAEFRREHGRPNGCRFFLMTHDALTAYVKIDELQFWVPEVQRIMENLPITEYFGWKPQLKFEVDYEVGPNLADMLEKPDLSAWSAA